MKGKRLVYTKGNTDHSRDQKKSGRNVFLSIVRLDASPCHLCVCVCVSQPKKAARTRPRLCIILACCTTKSQNQDNRF